MNTLQHGGAAQCAIRICNALRKQGVECRMLVAEEPESDYVSLAKPDKEIWYSNPLLAKIKHLLLRCKWYNDAEKNDITLNNIRKELKSPLDISHPLSHFRNIVNSPLIDWADVIHLHWVTNLVDYPTFFKNVKKPIIWTLHDMSPLLGLMHYESSNTIPPSELSYLDKKYRQIKSTSLRKATSLNTVAISKVMRQNILKSNAMSHFPCSLIHNGVDTTIFKRHENVDYEEKLKILNPWGGQDIINEDTTIFMFSAYNISEKRKGLENIIAAIEKCECKDKCLIATGKNLSDNDYSASFPIILTGNIESQDMLADLYSVADYFISASYDESFSQTILEAMACGCPVIATPTGIAPEIISSQCGVLVQGYDVQSIIQGINKAITTTFNPAEIRNRIIEQYDYSIIAHQYEELYQKVIDDDVKYHYN